MKGESVTRVGSSVLNTGGAEPGVGHLGGAESGTAGCARTERGVPRTAPMLRNLL